MIRSDNSGSITSAPVTPWGYFIGETGPGGGIIFYYDPNGFIMTDTGETAHWLEAAPEDMPGSFTWASREFLGSWEMRSGFHSMFRSPISGSGWRSIEGTGTAIGTGRRNTALILAIDANAPAALACRNYSNNGLTDWFLPSRDELNQLISNRAAVGNLRTSWPSSYWSSSQYDAAHVAAVGSRSDGLVKDYDFNVRAVRAF